MRLDLPHLALRRANIEFAFTVASIEIADRELRFGVVKSIMMEGRSR